MFSMMIEHEFIEVLCILRLLMGSGEVVEDGVAVVSIILRLLVEMLY